MINTNKNTRPVGIFDSGLGGLCAVREALKILPGEDIIYFGDTGRVPYGSKSYALIKKYARQDMNFLISKDVKIILVSCGTVSSVAINDLREYFPDVPIIGVVESACEKAVETANIKKNKKIGIIATEATISKGMYKKYINNLDETCEVYSKSCPLFVPLVEYGHISDEDIITKAAADLYLKEFKDLNLSSLILGCTHYPMIKNIIYSAVNVELIDVGLEAAHKLKKEMTERNLLNNKNNNKNKKGRLNIYISDEGLNFKNIASSFLGFDIKSGVEIIDIEKY